MFSEEEKIHLQNTVSQTYKMRDDVVWKKAFKYHNDKTKRRLGMHCTPCYYKVLLFILKNQL